MIGNEIVLKVQVVFVGRHYETADAMPESLNLADDATVDDALAALRDELPDNQPLAASCLVDVSGERLGTVAEHRHRALKDGDELLLVAPVAGG
jgi:molybdopterin converting factor small subunit